MNWARLQRLAHPFLHPKWLEKKRIRWIRKRSEARSSSFDRNLRRIFVDVSVITRDDAGTGIQRIVRAVASQLLASPPSGWQVIAVGATRKRPYHAVAWPTRQPGTAYEPMVAQPGDVFLGLDFALDDVWRHWRQLVRFKREGGRVWFVMYDLLPVQHPDWFSDKLVVRYRRWLATLAGLADGFHCISPPVESDLRAVLAAHYGLLDGFQTRILPMGWDISAARHRMGIPEGFDQWLKQLSSRPSALMVGTLEPRKGHADVLAAYELIWERGGHGNLVIVGRPGWKNDALIGRLRQHPQRGARLFWLEDASDEALERIYQACHGVIVASLAEGYGLPLLEALGHGKPVLARDIPVFRLHQACGIDYFDASATPEQLAARLEPWLQRGPVVRSTLPSLQSWSAAAHAVVLAADGGASQ